MNNIHNGVNTKNNQSRNPEQRISIWYCLEIQPAPSLGPNNQNSRQSREARHAPRSLSRQRRCSPDSGKISVIIGNAHFRRSEPSTVGNTYEIIIGFGTVRFGATELT